MNQILEKCTVCGGLIDEEDLFCGNCGTEAPHDTSKRTASTLATHSFQCAGCGASMSYSIKRQSLRCPFCGGTNLEKSEDHKVIAPTKVIPFRIDEEKAREIMRAAIGKGFWRPPDLSKRAVVTNMVPVYVPYWVFSAEVNTYWTADTSQTPGHARGDWFPMSGEHQASYQDVVVGASGALTPNETLQLCPFDSQAGVPPEDVDLDQYTVEQFNVARKYARPLAQSNFEALERKAVDTKFVPPRSRNVKVNLRIQNMQSQPMLLPIWIMAYQYKDQVYRFLINGQTGHSTGQTPFSYRKLFTVVGIVIGVAVAIGAMILVCSGIAAAL